MKDRVKHFIKKHNYCGLINFIKYLKSIYFSFSKRQKVFCLKCRKDLSYINRGHIINKYLKSHQVSKLQIGAGGNVLDGWLNTDFFPYAREIIVLDVTKPFPFGNNVFNYIFCEHMIEHITYNEGLKMLQECRRVLKPGGKIRISTPNLQVNLDIFKREKTQTQQLYMDWISRNWLQRAGIAHDNASFVLNLIMHGWGHKFVYDFQTISLALAEAGFRDVLRAPCGASDDVNLSGIERHGDTIKDIKAIEKKSGSAIDNEMNNFATLVAEAVKR